MIDITLQDIKDRFDLSFSIFGGSPITLIDNGYQIRIRTAVKINSIRGTTTINWDYFMTDKDGIIYRSPRGYAKEFNKKIRISDIKEQYEFYEKLKEKNN